MENRPIRRGRLEKFKYTVHGAGVQWWINAGVQGCIDSGVQWCIVTGVYES